MTDDHRDGPSDEELIAIWRGDPDGATGQRAFAQLVDRHHERVYQHCWRILRDRERALDAAQDVFVSVFRGLPRFTGRARFTSWLFSIARNRCLTEQRKRHPVVEDDEAIAAAADGRPGPDRELIERLDHEALLDLIERVLSPLDQDVLYLRSVERRTHDDIARLLGIERDGVRVMLQRAKRQLARALDDHGEHGRHEEGL